MNPLNRRRLTPRSGSRLEVNHHTTVPPLTQDPASTAVRSDTMAAILDYCVFTKLVCPLPPSGCLTFPAALLWSPGKPGLCAAMAMKEGVQLEEGGEVDSCCGNLTSRRPPPLCSPRCRKKNWPNESGGMTDVGAWSAGSVRHRGGVSCRL